MDNSMINSLEAKHGVKIKQVFIPDAPPLGQTYGVYKDGWGLYTFISYVAGEYGYSKRELEYTIMVLKMKIRELQGIS